MHLHAVLAALVITSPASAQQSLAARCAAMAAEGNVSACERAIAENPADDESRRNLGRAFLAVGDGGMSILTYRDLLTRHPDDWTLHFDLAVATTAAMRYGEAVEPVLTALRLHPGDVPALKIARIALQMSGRHAEAVPVLERLAAEGDVTAMNDLGEVFEVGRGVARASAPAVAWYGKAGAAGHGGAAARLADAYLNGELDLAPDAAAAELWAKRARGD